MYESLADKMEKRLGDIQIDRDAKTLRETLSWPLLRRIALEASDVAAQHFVKE